MNKPSIHTLVQNFEAEQIQRQLPDFGPGDTVVVNVKVKEGNRERVQAYEGVVIAIKNAGLNSAFTVRKISHGFGVERVFQTHSATIDSVDVKRRGKVRAGKLYYLRGLQGKKARIKEDLAGLRQEVRRQGCRVSLAVMAPPGLVPARSDGRLRAAVVVSGVWGEGLEAGVFPRHRHPAA